MGKVTVTVSGPVGSDEAMFTEVYDDGICHVQWLPFWSAVWHMLKLIFTGHDVRMDE